MSKFVDMLNEKLGIFSLFIKIYLLTVSFFWVFRIILFLTEFEKITNASMLEIMYAFIMGLRFDIVISSYILLFPFLYFSTYNLFKDLSKMHNKIFFYYTYIIFSVTFFICTIDIPYFKHFFSRFSYSAFVWIDTPDFVFNMIFEEARYWGYFFIFILHNILFYLILKKIFNSQNLKKNILKKYFIIPTNLIVLLLIILGIRGRIDEKAPIQIGTAYFSTNSLLNQLGLNPNFTFFRSILDTKKHEKLNYLNNLEAIDNLKKYLQIKDNIAKHPLSRKIFKNNSLENKKYNVVVVIMESMSGYYFEHKNILVPFLDSLSKNGIYFKNCYTAGIHTHNGIFSTIFSYPAIAKQHAMKLNALKEYNGIAKALRNNGYSTTYFTTHDGQFDNVEGFLLNNQFERVISKKDYPANQLKTTLGVPDDYMFEFSIPVLDDLHKKEKPFLSVFLTSSNHGPYYLPDYFKPKSKNLLQQMVEYSDWSIQKFMNLAKSKEWFDNTLFVFVADHGAYIRSSYDISLDYVHTPLIFYAPKIIKEQIVIDKITGQIDIFPSIMYCLNLDYENTTLGINIFENERPFIFFNQHEKYAVLDDKWLLVVYENKTVKLFNYKNGDEKNYLEDFPQIVREMKKYLYSHLQGTFYINNTKN